MKCSRDNGNGPVQFACPSWPEHMTSDPAPNPAPRNRWCTCLPPTAASIVCCFVCVTFSVWTWANTDLIVSQNKALTQENVKLVAHMNDVITGRITVKPHR
jgi:hypothetical protein